MNRLKERYEKEAVPALTKEFGYTNVMAVPKIAKVVVNMGLGEATSNAKIIEVGADELGRITGQKPVVRRAKKSIAAFKVRKGQPIATSVTLVPTGCPFRTLNCAIDFFDRRVTGFCPVMRPSSSAPTSMIFAFEVASPRPMFTTTFAIFGTAMTLV